MRIVKKIKNATAMAYQLGAGSQEEKNFINEGKIKRNDDGIYEIFSQEANSDKGEIVKKGDYFKIDKSGYPYPNSKQYFEENHKCIGENLYEQIAKPLFAWCFGDEKGEEIQFLIDKKGLILNYENLSAFFEAPLWGTILTANSDAVLIFYEIERDENGNIFDASFNFVAKDEFEKTYKFI